jgi:predicted HicB family RNase H-like nuclease
LLTTNSITYPINTLLYKGYNARIEFVDLDRIFVRQLAGIRNIVAFYGSSVDELEAACREAGDDYLAHCAQLGLLAAARAARGSCQS